MVSRLPLWQHGYGESVHPTPGSCFGIWKGSFQGGAEEFSIVLLHGREKNKLLNSMIYFSFY
jgi:hypothetical protein